MRLETEAAIRAARVAQRIADSRIGSAEITSKGGIDLVTATDVACEDAIRAELLASFPTFPVIGEERGGARERGKPYWLVDPICGTRPFASNIPLYCTNIALVENGAVTAAAIGVGRTGEIIFAERGSGAWLQTEAGDKRVSVSDESRTIWIDGKSEQTAQTMYQAIVSRRWYVWAFSSTIAHFYLATGRIAGIIHLGLPSGAEIGSVHAAAGCLAAQEAGAIVTDLNTGRPWGLATYSVLIAATTRLHAELLDLVRPVMDR
jgi:myo-inositol-1(or 4)-monophosphatase